MTTTKYTSPDNMVEIYVDDSKLTGFSWCVIRSYHDVEHSMWAEWKQWMPNTTIADADTAAMANGWTKEVV